MNTHTPLRLVDSTRDEPDAYYLERRMAMRHRMTGRATTLLQATEKGDHFQKISSVELVDISDTGLGAMTQEPWDIGREVTVFLPSHGPDGGFNATGEVVRCKRHDGEHEVGIRFFSQSAACA